MGLTRKQIIMLTVLISGSFITILNQTIVTPALPTIMRDMNVDASTVQWLTTGFTLVNAVMIPVTAFLTDRFATRRLFATCMFIFTGGTLLAAWGPIFPVILAGRLVQAVGAGAMMPMVMTVLLLTFPPERRGTAMGIFGVVIGVGPAVGPVIAGVVIDNSSWHFMFLAIAILAFLDGIISIVVVGHEDKVVPEGLYLDKLSVVLSTFGFGSMLYGFSAIGSSGFTPSAGIAILVGLVIACLFFHRQLKLDVPMLQVRVLKTRRFLVGTIVGMVIQGSIMANGVLIPIYIQSLCGYSATLTAIVMMPGAVVMAIMSPISGRLFDKYGPRNIALFGLTVFLIATCVMCTLTVSTPLLLLGTMFCLRMFGMSLVNMPINTWAMNSLKDKLIAHGNAVNNTLRQVAGSFGGALMVSAYSIMGGLQIARGLSNTEAYVHAFNFAFEIQVVLVAIALIISFLFVKEETRRKSKRF